MSLGRCLHLLSEQKRPNSALQWTKDCCAVINDLSELSENDSEKVLPILSGAIYGALSTVMRQQEADLAEVCSQETFTAR